ncbi:MAG: hypothetical protein CVV47_03890 [Spirochaetae bacterium HGW-Spirochaetae-3]|nr:MAG: hypothetical protein CVV47_03890 [Spirochaetae bacterium HGW-Spirochaetae-3]
MASHDAATALRALRSAVAACPATDRAELARRLYWLSIALRRIGKDGLAVKALSNAQRLAPRSRARTLYERFANGYGMPKSSCVEHDDYRAFCSIQIRKYLERVPDGRFADQDEIDTVLTMIADAWLKLYASTAISSVDCDEKLRIFREAGVAFPALRETRAARPGRVIVADFYRGRTQRTADRCLCGSGLPYRMCCGRIRPLYESDTV